MAARNINLKIFNKNGDSYTLYDDGNLFALEKIHFPIISEGLFESETLYILEKTADGLNTPFPINTSNSTQWRLRFDNYETNDINEDNFFFYTINWNADQPEIIKQRELIITIDNPAGYTDTDIIYGNNKIPIQINIGFTSKNEGIFKNFLILEEIIDINDPISHKEFNNDVYYKNDNSYTQIICIWDLYAESTGEDERYKNLLENLGLELKTENWYLFKNAELEDDNVDWNIINNKRKELLLEHSNIWPYIGSYRGLRNVLNWLGWNELSVKEFWKNIQTEKRAYTEIWTGDNNFWKKLNSSELWRKTGELKFTYPFNKETQLIDELGFPIVQKTDNFTIDEILFKLWGLKSFIQDQFLPLGTKIIDITGEGVYFEKYNLTTWSNKVKIWNSYTPVQQSIDYMCTDLIEDWSWKFKTWGIVNNSDLTISQVYADLLDNWKYDWLIDHYSINFPFKPLDNDKPIIGSPLLLKNTSFNITWDFWDTSWDNNNHNTWDDVQWGNFYEMEWIISKKAPNMFSISSGRKHITDIAEWETFLPYSGNWTIILRMWNSDNALHEKIYENEINIKNQKIELSLITNYLQSTKTWDDTKSVWDDLNSSWYNFGINKQSDLNHIKVPLEDLTARNYLNNNYVLLEQNTYDNNFTINRLGSNIYWDKLDQLTWDDLDSISWNDYNIHGFSTPGFNLINCHYNYGASLDNQGKQSFIYNGIYGYLYASEWQGLLQELQESQIDWIQEFEYSIIKPDPLDDFTWFISAVAKNASSNSLYILYGNGLFLDPNYNFGNSYTYLNWNSWTGPQNTPPIWNNLWNGYNEFLNDGGDGTFNVNWNNLLPNFQEYEYRVKYDLSQYHDDWINFEKSWIQSHTYNFKIGHPTIFTTKGSKIPGLKNIIWELKINNIRKLLTEHDYLVWLPLEKDDINLKIHGFDGNGNYVEEKFILKHL